MRVFDTKKTPSFDSKNTVIVHYWPQTERNSAGHVSLEIVFNDERVYVSYWHKRKIDQCEKDKLRTQYDGIEPFWTQSFDQDCMIEGYRHAALENPKLNAEEILEKVRSQSFAARMLPTQSIKLYSLDAKKILEALRAYQANIHKWAFFSGYLYHAKDAHNCSSIVLYLLQQGGFDELVSGGYGSELRKFGAVIGLLVSPFFASSFMQFFALTLLSGCVGAATGGAIDGYQAAQPFLRACQINKKITLPQDIGIAVLAMLVTAVQSVLFQVNWCLSRFPFPGNVASFTLPGNVLSLVMEAAKNEASMVGHIQCSAFAIR